MELVMYMFTKNVIIVQKAMAYALAVREQDWLKMLKNVFLVAVAEKQRVLIARIEFFIAVNVNGDNYVLLGCF